MKRFTETDKWRDKWFQSLHHGSKLLFIYFCDTCNNAGFYEENEREACFHLGITEEQYQGALKGLDRGIKGASGWLWVRRFLRHQKNEPLNPDNPAHKQIIRLIGEQVGRFEEFPEFQQFIAPLKGLLSPIKRGIQSPIGIGKGTGKGKRESAEREQIASEIYDCYPRKVAKPEAIKAICGAISRGASPIVLLERTKAYAEIRRSQDNGFTPYPATWFNRDSFNDDPETWKCQSGQTMSNNGQRQKLPAPIYDQLPPKRDTTEAEYAEMRRIAAEEKEKLRTELNR